MDVFINLGQCSVALWIYAIYFLPIFLRSILIANAYARDSLVLVNGVKEATEELMSPTGGVTEHM